MKTKLRWTESNCLDSVCDIEVEDCNCTQVYNEIVLICLLLMIGYLVAVEMNYLEKQNETVAKVNYISADMDKSTGGNWNLHE